MSADNVADKITSKWSRFAALSGWETLLGELTLLPRSSPKPHTPALSTRLPAPALETEATERPQVTFEPGHLRALLCHW